MRPLTAALSLLAASVLALGTGGESLGQDLPLPGEGFDWERVGDQPISANDLAFDTNGTLWATGLFGPYRLDLSNGFPGRWIYLADEPIDSAILPLGTDTLVATTGGSTHRSLDGGRMWELVYDDGDEGLYEVPPGHAFAGRILSGDDAGMGYSTDRATSFNTSKIPGQGTGGHANAAGFVSLPPGAPHAGRFLAAGRWGISASDDGGVMFVESGLYDTGRYVGEGIGLLEGPGGGARVVVAGRISGVSGRRVWVSDDGADTWGPTDEGVLLPEGEPFGPGGSVGGVLDLGGGHAMVVLGRGTVYQTDDGGETWSAIGRAPDINDDIGLNTAVVGPEGRLYVGLFEQGASRAWVWRTVVPVLTAAEPTLPETDRFGLSVWPNPAAGTANVAFQLSTPSWVSVILLDTLGREVAVLHDGPLAAGSHSLAIRGRGLPSGVYAVRLSVNGTTTSELVTLLGN